MPPSSEHQFQSLPYHSLCSIVYAFKNDHMKDLKTKDADSKSAEQLSTALDTANQNYKDLMESKEKLSADFEDYKQRSESTIETMQTSMNDKDTQLDETKAKLDKLQSELNEAHQKIQYHERNDQERFQFDAAI